MVCALSALTLFAPLAVLQSALPRVLAWPACIAALGHGAWLTRREWSQSMRLLVVPTGSEPVTLDGNALDDVQVQWRGPLAFLRWRTPVDSTPVDSMPIESTPFDSKDRKRTRHLAWWPDTLPAARRRELKLAVQAREAARPPGSMAP